MKVVIVGATGTIGTAVTTLLEDKHEVIRVGHNRGDYNIDLASDSSIRKFFESIGRFDALISAAGLVRFGKLGEMHSDDYLFGLQHKVMGQVKLFLMGRNKINDNGSITLTSGMLSDYPIEGSSAVSMANGALNSFVRAAALETKRGLRVNVVSPGWIRETMEAMGMDGSQGKPVIEVAKAYLSSLEGTAQGTVIEP